MIDVIRNRRRLAVGFPLLVVLVHGVVWRQFQDPSGWKMLLASGVFSAIPLLASLVFVRRRRNGLDDPSVRDAARFAVTVVFWYTVVLWLLPLPMILVRPPFPSGLVWFWVVATLPLYVYPLLLVLEWAARRRLRTVSDSAG